MPRLLALGSFWVVLSSAGLALAQEPPPLEPPSLDVPETNAKEAKPAVVPPPATRTEGRPLLVIPGVTAPGRPSSTIPRPRTVQQAPAVSSSGSISLDRPVAGGGSLEPGSPARPRSNGSSSTVGVTIPLTIEPLDDEPAGKAGGTKATQTPAVVERPTLRSLADEKPPIAPLTDEPAPEAGPRRAPSLFGRFLGPARSAAPPGLPDRGAQDPCQGRCSPRCRHRRGRAKRIEREINDSLGDRLRSLEVRVSGRNVLIVARASRFWQKRSVRRALETLPGLAGYRARVDVPD